MINNTQVADGLMCYVKKEVLPVLPNYVKVLAGAALLHNANRLTEIVSTLSSGTLLKTFDVFNANGEIDVDMWCQDLKRSMDEFCDGRLTISFLGSNSLILTTNDIDTIKRYMKGELR